MKYGYAYYVTQYGSKVGSGHDTKQSAQEELRRFKKRAKEIGAETNFKVKLVKLFTNPGIPRERWVKGRVRITKSGKIQFKAAQGHRL